MFGNPKWFKRRKYTGWGLTPATWQGWVYVIVILCTLLLVSLIASSLKISYLYMIAIISSMILLIVADTVHIALHMNKDERETLHEALSERNASWVIGIVLVAGVLFELTFSLLKGSLSIDPFIIAALLAGVITKGISNWYYADK